VYARPRSAVDLNGWARLGSGGLDWIPALVAEMFQSSSSLFAENGIGPKLVFARLSRGNRRSHYGSQIEILKEGLDSRNDGLRVGAGTGFSESTEVGRCQSGSDSWSVCKCRDNFS
jgi:hypothetical protein